ncbi:MAG TPA: hypothetical protein VL096_01520 [Pirellulaceae bacterium]|nr:hypothetical protein [Pirellulaceae bacterium]
MRTLIIIAVLFASLPTIAEARQRRTNEGQVAHSRRAPVVMHRALPPFKGQHVYAGR